MDDSLESLLEKATNPKNTYEDWEFIMAFCDRVNTDVQGPQTALKIIVPKIRSDNDKVALLALTLLEACVKNCGLKFHQELGKFKFLNELIRMLSPKYLGDSTSPAVKERIKSMLYSWKVGLPQEAKINEAYLMLKREGLIFDESVDPDRTLQPDRAKPKVALIEDPKQSQMLQKLLSSKNAEDLRAANRLIREMVRRDEKRMQKLQQRLEDVELIQNNVKLLNELLSHWKDTSGDGERQLIDELYKSIEKLRPNLFRMASELKQNEEGMTDILQANDSVLRVMDLYNAKMNKSGPSGATASTTNGIDSATGKTESTPSTSSGPPEGATAITSTVASSSEGQATASAENEASGRNEAASNALIDLADLNFDPTPVSGVGGVSTASGVGTTDLNSSIGLGSLLDDLGTLDLGTPTGSNLGMFPPAASTNFGSGVTSQPFLTPSSGGLFGPPSSFQQPVGMPMGAPLISNSPMSASSTSPFSSLSSTQNQPLGGQTPQLSVPSPSQQQAGLGISGSPGAAMGMGMASGGMGMGPSSGMGMAFGAGTQQPAVDPLAVLDEAFVPLEAIQPGTVPALPVMAKNNVSVTFHFAKEEPPTSKNAPENALTVDMLTFAEKPKKNIPAPGIIVIVISIINTSPVPVTKFQFQAAVPKVMRVKLQPPTGVDLTAYNPVLPPPSISQVMLLANPTKAKVRMKYRVSYQQGGGEVVEMGEVANFPQLP